MAVITKYIVVRNGVELDQVFDVKKEAEAYDKMLDAADNLAVLIKTSGINIDIDEETIDEISIFLAKNGQEVTKILKGIKPVVSYDTNTGDANAGRNKVKKSDDAPNKKSSATGSRKKKK